MKELINASWMSTLQKHSRAVGRRARLLDWSLGFGFSLGLGICRLSWLPFHCRHLQIQKVLFCMHQLFVEGYRCRRACRVRLLMR